MSVKARLERLEASALVGERVIGFTYVNDWRGEHPPGSVTLCRTHEQMPLAEFERRYPGGVLIQVEYVEDWRNEHQNET